MGGEEEFTYVVFLTKFFAQRRAHDGPSDAGWSAIVGLARLSPRRVKG